MFSSFFFNNMFAVLLIWMYNTQYIEGGRSIFFPWDLNRARSYRSLWEYLYGKKKNCSLVSFKCVSMIKEHKALVYNSNWLLILMRMRTTNKREAKKNNNKPFVIICCVVGWYNIMNCLVPYCLTYTMS